MEDSVELDCDPATLELLREMFGSQRGELTERVATKRFSGHIVLKGFSEDVVGFSDEMKIRVQAANMSGRVRLIIDLKV